MNGHFNVADFNRRIWRLWMEHPLHRGSRIPKFVTQPAQTGGLLYLGLNPSLPKLISRKFVEWMFEAGFIEREMIAPKKNYRDRFLWDNSGLEYGFDDTFVEVSARVHHEARRYYPRFFRRLNNLAGRLGVSVEDYGHVDLFFWLEAESGIVASQVSEAPDFADKQKQLAFELIAAWQPRVIVCPYKKAAEELSLFCNAIHPALTVEYRNTGCRKLELAEALFPWSNQTTFVFSCAGLPSHWGRGMNENEVEEASEIIVGHTAHT